MQKSKVIIPVVLILFLLFSPISTHANSFDDESFFIELKTKVLKKLRFKKH